MVSNSPHHPLIPGLLAWDYLAHSGWNPEKCEWHHCELASSHGWGLKKCAWIECSRQHFWDLSLKAVLKEWFAHDRQAERGWQDRMSSQRGHQTKHWGFGITVNICGISMQLASFSDHGSSFSVFPLMSHWPSWVGRHFEEMLKWFAGWDALQRLK